MKSSLLLTKLLPNIYLVNNQKFYGEKVNTYIIELPDKLLFFDIPDYSPELEKEILQFKKPCYALLSHGSCGTSSGTTWQKKINLIVYMHEGDKKHPWLNMKPDSLFTIMPSFADNILVIHTPGHSAGSICVLDTNTNTLFTGDTFQPMPDGEIKDFTKETPESYENNSNRFVSCKKLTEYDFINVLPFHYSILLQTGKKSLLKFISDK